MLLYLGTAFGDLLMVTLHNVVAIVLLMRCELRLLQSVVVGVIVIHLLLIPGTAFLTGGSDIRHQTLHPHQANLNHSLLLIGVLAILLPTALFSALDQGADTGAKEGATQTTASELVSDTTTAILQISRGIAIILLVVYVASRFYLHDPPSGNNTLMTPQEAHPAIKHEEALLLAEEPKTNVWACMLMLLGTVAMMAVTADFLVDSIQYVRAEGGIPEEWFGLVFLPNLSKLSADVVVAIIFFIKSIYHKLAGNRTRTPSILARGRAIDLSIQFTLWWMPFLVLLGWWTARPMHLLFDYFKVTLLLGTCLLVNYITADAQTNWVEGLILIAFYVMIAVTAWFYPGDTDVHFQLTLLCPASVTEAIAHGGDAGAEILRRALRAA
ncbi:hypothetical protein C8T65DRAFT_742493 [Cerioporus squamosus]|nr:hypothetical protein C8T65DRAFT_742493 [Cerioporus squamosus]